MIGFAPRRVILHFGQARLPSQAVGWVERSETHPTNLVQSHLPGFPAQHRLLAGDAPVIAGERAVLAERAVTGHNERERALADGGIRNTSRVNRLVTV